ncbi:CvpA family protein [Mangrovimonas aestuarii]|uniref:CvpA family protein n=1 Tax=Mangrovimonas aestuarii TaxID=3018443 RepID=UPI00237951FE|nr:CvpA family protein [Mangrovimonas aestuarii]
MNVLDIVLAALLLFGLVRGFIKGLFVEIASLVALVAGVYGAIHFSYFAGNMLIDYVNWDDNYVNIVAFAITFVVIVVVIALAGKALTKLADFAALGMLNKILGGVFGALKIALVLSVILIVFSKMNNTLPFVEEDELENSILYQPVKNLVTLVFPSFLESRENEHGNKETA